MVQQNLHMLTIRELKLELQKFNLTVKGNKRNLVMRIVDKFEEITQKQLSEISSLAAMSNSTDSNFDATSASIDLSFPIHDTSALMQFFNGSAGEK